MFGKKKSQTNDLKDNPFFPMERWNALRAGFKNEGCTVYGDHQWMSVKRHDIEGSMLYLHNREDLDRADNDLAILQSGNVPEDYQRTENKQRRDVPTWKCKVCKRTIKGTPVTGENICGSCLYKALG